MFERLKAIFQNEKTPVSESKKRPVIITIHGYGRRRQHEMDNLVLWSKGAYEIIQFDLYDLFDENDNDWHKWVSRAKSVVNEYELQKREIVLVGFSMGGVIAAYLAATSPNVKKLILLAPAFQYLHMDAITSVITKSAVSFFTNEEQKEDIEVPKSFYSTFMEVVKQCKPYIQKVPCPVLILHGDVDEVIPVKSSVYAFDRIPHEQKKLILFHNGHHRLLMDEAVNWEVFQVMRLFLDDHILHGATIPQAEDILEQYRKQLREKLQASTKEQEEKEQEVQAS